MVSAADSLWQFSIRFYTAPHVEENLLRLQNEYQLNVNYLLLALWHGLSGRGLISSEQFNQWRHTTQDLEQSIAWLRMVRQSVKAQLGTQSGGLMQDYYLALREAELKGEQTLQAQLAAWSQPAGSCDENTGLKIVHDSFHNYLHALDRESDDTMNHCWSTICNAAVQFVRAVPIS